MADISPEDLIPLVEQRRVIWDKDSDIFSNKALKAAAWREICCVFKPDFEKLDEKDKKDFAKSVTTKWIHIRDAFLRSQRTHKKTILRVGAVKRPRPYVYKNLLKFLTKAEDPLITNESCDESQSGFSISSGVSEAVPEKEYQPPPAKRKPKIGEDMTLEEKLTLFLDSKLIYQQENRHVSFMKGILPSLLNLDEDETLEFQIGVLQLIQKMKRRRQSEGEYSNDIKIFET